MIYHFRDIQGVQAWYDARAIIEFQGTLSRTGVSQGHYVCDVQYNKIWFRTNDDKFPKKISVADVSRKGYAVLFQRT